MYVVTTIKNNSEKKKRPEADESYPQLSSQL